MSGSQTLRCRVLALLVTGLSAFAALAGETLRDETTIVVRTTAGVVEKVVFEGELADPEIRPLTTAKGNPAVLSRNGAQMSLEVAGESFDIPTPDAELASTEIAGDDAAAPHERKLIIKHVDEDTTTDAAGTEQRRIVRVKRIQPGDGTEAELLALDPMDPELALEAAGEGKRVIVMRKLVHERSDAVQVQ
jgi:hypothetical protein